MGDQSLECGDEWGCNEHMADKQCRYARARLIESSDARAVVCWRYALCDIRYEIANQDSLTGWGDWADEYYVIYPDMVTTRHQILWSNNFGVALDTSNERPGVPWHQYQETIMFNQPGTWPRDNVDEVEALTVATMDGRTYACKWGPQLPVAEEEIVDLDVVKNATIQMTNLKSEYKPFIIFEPGSIIAPWVGEDHSFWNHWPVAQLPSDGRWAPANDRPSHTSLSCGAPVIHEGEGNSHIAVTLYGLTDEPIQELAPLARSWNQPAKLEVIKGDVKSEGYDKFQRAYVLECRNGASQIKLGLSGSDNSPLVNPAFVLKHWGNQKAVVEVSGEKIDRGSDYRAGYEKKIDGVNLVLWFDGTSKEHETLSITPVK